MVANLKLHLYIYKCNQRKKLTISKGVLLKMISSKNVKFLVDLMRMIKTSYFYNMKPNHLLLQFPYNA